LKRDGSKFGFCIGKAKSSDGFGLIKRYLKRSKKPNQFFQPHQICLKALILTLFWFEKGKLKQLSTSILCN
jgi:hypothetical protein